MGLITLPSPVLLTSMAERLTGAMALAAGNTLDAAGEYEAHSIIPHQTMVVSHVAIRLSSVVGSPTIVVQLESSDASGLPSGTILGATNNATVTSGVMTTAATVLALGESATLTPGNTYWLKIIYNSGTSVATRTLNNNLTRNIPLRVTNTSGAPVKSANAAIPTFALGSDATTWYSLPHYWQIETITHTTFNNTNGAMRGNKYTIPMNCRVCGIQTLGGTSLGDFNIVLQDGSNNDLESTAYDGNLGQVTANLAKMLMFDTPVECDAGDVVRYGIEPTSATNVNYSVVNLWGADYRRSMPGGIDMFGSVRASGTWTDETDRVYLMDLLIDQVDDGSGGGGGGGVARSILNAGVGIC